MPSHSTMPTNSAYTHIDLFSGIGGFALAARWNGIQTIQFCELDPFCQKVLNKNFPGVPCHDDIKTFDGRRHAGQFILTGGFPCQPFSVAGKRRGKEDDRFLWPEMLRVVSEARPDWVIGENVAGFINMGLDDCVADLEGEGYEVQAFDIPACAVSAPHRRDRVWIVANTQYSASARFRRNCGKVLSEQTTGLCRKKASWSEQWIEAATRFCRVDAGVSNRVDRVNRLKSLGNSIVPQVASEIMRCILQVERESQCQA